MRRRLNLVYLLLFTLIASHASAFSRIGVEPNGNLLNDGIRTMDYTAWNLPKLITKVTGTNAGSTLAYDYDASHARIKEVSTLHGTTYYAGGYELVIPTSSTAAQNQTEERTYLSSPEGSIGVVTQKTTANAAGGPTSSTDTAYWHKDHLGSLIAITNLAGTVTQRFRFDAWGNRDCLSVAGVVISCSSSNTGGANNTGSEERGFTGHEMLDEVGLIHMNGRLFDPAIARFTQADPIIQEPLNSQNYNRYSYVLNNPLVYTDPSGYSAWTKVRKPLAAVAIMVATWYFAGPAAAAYLEVGETAGIVGNLAAEASAYATAASIQAAATMAGGFAAGGVTGGNIESAILGAIQAMVSMGIGDATYHGSAPPSAGLYAANVLAHAALGCGMAAAQGGTCKSGALAGGFSAAAGPVVAGLTEGNFYGGLAGRMAAGCVGSYIGKGSCEAGAVTAAFDYIYNECGKTGMCVGTATKVYARANIAGGLFGWATALTGVSVHMGIEVNDGYGITTFDGAPSDGKLITKVNSTDPRKVFWRNPVGPPIGVDPSDFGRAVSSAAIVASGSQAYSFPNVLTGRLPPGQFNSNSFSTSVLHSAYGDYTPMMPYHAVTNLGYIAPGYVNRFQITR